MNGEQIVLLGCPSSRAAVLGSEIGSIQRAAAAQTILHRQKRRLVAEIFQEVRTGRSILKSNFSNARRLVKTWRMPHWLTQEFITFGTDSVIQVHGHAAIDGQGGVRDDGPGRRRQEHAHELSSPAESTPRCSKRRKTSERVRRGRCQSIRSPVESATFILALRRQRRRNFRGRDIKFVLAWHSEDV